MDLSVSKEGDAQFDAAVLAAGRAPRFEYHGDPQILPGPLLWSIAQGVVLIRDIFLKEAGRNRTIPEIIERTNTSSDFNAVAFKHESRFFVSVNLGALVLTQDLVHRVLSTPTAFPWIGDSSREELDRNFHPVMADAKRYFQAMKADMRRPKPHDPTRELCAAMFNLIANEFVVAHEVWHIVGGHLDWLSQHSASRAINECVDSFEMASIAEDKQRRLERQALEMDADSFAVFQITRKPIALIDPSGSHHGVQTQEQAVEVAVVCGAVMVGAFFTPMPDPQRWPFATHPPAIVRQMMMIDAADRALLIMKLDNVRRSTTADPSWVARIREEVFVRLWKWIGGEERGAELATALGSAGEDHARLVMEAWRRVSSQVRSFSPMPTYLIYPPR
jgi:hypothetical protein